MFIRLVTFLVFALNLLRDIMGINSSISISVVLIDKSFEADVVLISSMLSNSGVFVFTKASVNVGGFSHLIPVNWFRHKHMLSISKPPFSQFVIEVVVFGSFKMEVFFELVDNVEKWFCFSSEFNFVELFVKSVIVLLTLF